MRIIISLSLWMLSGWVFAQNCPELLNVELLCEDGNCSGVCPGKELNLSIEVLRPKNGDEYEVFYGDSANFDPRSGEGVSMGREVLEIEPCTGDCPAVVAINIDACDSEYNEYLIIHSGSGFEVDELEIDFANQNNFCPECGDLGGPCDFLPNPLTNLNGCTGLIPAGPGDVIPPGATVIVFVSSNANPASYDFGSLCNAASTLGTDIYILQSACTRFDQVGAFTNGTGTGERITTIDFCGGCSQDITYNAEDLLNMDGETWIQGSIDPIGCIGAPVPSEFNFTTIEFPINQEFCDLSNIYFKVLYYPSEAGCPTDIIKSSEVFLEDYTCPQVEILGPEGLCSGQTAELLVSGTWDTYRWRGDQSGSNSTLTVEPGTYELSVQDENGCVANDEITIAAFNDPEPVVDIQPMDTICPGDTVEISLSGALYYILEDGFMLPLRFNLSTQQDTIIPFTAEENGCTVEDTIFIYTNNTLCGVMDCEDLEISDTYNDTICTIDQPVRVLLNSDDLPLGGEGLWSGFGIIDSITGLFDPALAGVGNHPVVYNYMVDTCEIIVHDTVVVVPGPEVTFNGAGTYCKSEGSLDLWLITQSPLPISVTYQVDANLPQSTPFSGVDSIPISIPYNLIDSQIVILGYSNGVCFQALDNNNVARVQDGLGIVANHRCNPAEGTWTPIVDLSGDPLDQYGVVGPPGIFDGSRYTGDPLPLGTEFIAVFNSASILCAPEEVRLPSPSCVCVSQAGEIGYPGDTLFLCRESTGDFDFTHNGEAVLDEDDALKFILHDGVGEDIGQVLYWADSPSLTLPLSESLDSGYYYFMAVAGNLQGDTIDFTDGCTTFSNAIPVRVRPFPVLNMLPEIFSCAEGFIPVDLPIEGGTAPYVVEYYSGERILQIATETDSFSISLSFEANDTFQILTIQDANCFGDVFNESIIRIPQIDTGTFQADTCVSTVQIGNTRFDRDNPTGIARIDSATALGCDSFVMVDINFLPLPEGNLNQSICENDTIMINGTAYHADNPVGQEFLFAASRDGCDSIVNINLNILRIDTAFINPVVCIDQRFTLGGEEFNASNPSGIVTLANAATSGCDSVIMVNVIFETPDTTLFNPTICWNEMIEINGTFYDYNNPIGIESLSANDSAACDSIIRIELQFPDTIFRVITACSGDEVTIGDQVFNENNSEAVVFLSDSTGCDSLYFIAIQFEDQEIGLVEQTLCAGESVFIGDIEFNQTNPQGSVTLTGASSNGCDSIVEVALDFVEPKLNIQRTLCTGSAFEFNGTTYDAINPYDSITLAGASKLGCDSTIIIDLSFEDSIVVVIDSRLCPGESITVNGIVFDESRPKDRFFFENGSVNGCDSIIRIDLSFHPAKIDTFSPILCPGGSLDFNGMLYDMDSPEGLEVIPGGARSGCDSMVYINLSFEPMVATLNTRVVGCDAAQDRSIVISNVSSGIPPYRIVVDATDTFSVTQFPFQIYVEPDAESVSLEIRDQTTCVFTEIVEFVDDSTQSTVLLVGDDDILLGESTTIALSTNFPLDRYTLIRSGDDSTCVNCLPLTITPHQTVSYKVIAIGQNGCIIEDIITIQVEGVFRIFVPNIFSPNGDGVNDQFQIFPGTNLERIHSLRIYDYWGELLFSADDYYPDESQPAWDGTHRGQYLNPGVFPYIIEAEFINGERRFVTGSITLVR